MKNYFFMFVAFASQVALGNPLHALRSAQYIVSETSPRSLTLTPVDQQGDVSPVSMDNGEVAGSVKLHANKALIRRLLEGKRKLANDNLHIIEGIPDDLEISMVQETKPVFGEAVLKEVLLTDPAARTPETEIGGVQDAADEALTSGINSPEGLVENRFNVGNGQRWADSIWVTRPFPDLPNEVCIYRKPFLSDSVEYSNASTSTINLNELKKSLQKSRILNALNLARHRAFMTAFWMVADPRTRRSWILETDEIQDNGTKLRNEGLLIKEAKRFRKPATLDFAPYGAIYDLQNRAWRLGQSNKELGREGIPCPSAPR